MISIENTNVANTLIMIALAPMLSALISFVFLKENPDQKTWVAIIITTSAVVYIFYDALDAGDFLGNFLGLVCALGVAVGAVIIRAAKKIVTGRKRNLANQFIFFRLLIHLHISIMSRKGLQYC